ncbi:flagellar assembly peptidoglycan hydrolase FlgJ [Salinisphaera sp. T31B1]|uniref:flagellar assembly peptidoglycan hydrolase FlgJ n=1 Tax=Salinisphaera sp. T31B1 TaxID=727963 RepID=UPI003340D5DE
MAVDASGSFALDVQSITRLKHSARAAPQQGLNQAARQFEALFLQKMLETMREAMPKSGLLHSHQSDTYDSLMDQQWAQTLARRGIGLADMMTRQMQRPESQGAGATDAAAGIATARPRVLSASEALPGAPAPAALSDRPRPVVDTAAAPPLRDVPAYAPTPLVALDGTAGTREAASRALLPDHVNAFIDRMGGAARTAARETGVPQHLILAQAALETGWGRHETTRADGRPSYNVFNIKATGWSGDTAEVMTHEYAGGQARAERAAFRAYDSYDQAFADYARLISRSPRYAGVAAAPNAAAAAHELQAAGYATDPAYADKLVAIMRQFEGVGTAAPAVVELNTSTPLFEEVAADDARIARNDPGLTRTTPGAMTTDRPLATAAARGLAEPPAQAETLARLF